MKESCSRSVCFIEYLRNISGSIMPLTAVMLPLILGMAGVGFDVSVWMMNRRDLQSAADAAAIAAAYELASTHGVYLPEDFDPDDEENTSYPEYAALKEAEKNGFDPDRGDLDVEIGLDDDGLTMVSATIEQEDYVYFSSLLFRQDVYVSAAAASFVLEPIGDFCLLALDTSADGAVTAVGAVEIEAEGCGIAVNSSSDQALDLTGNVSIDIGELNIVGDMEVGANVDLEYNSASTNSSRIPDPYENLDVPDYDGCDYNNFSVTGDATLQPGVYCGGISISGNGTVEFEPGVYILDGGDFRVTGNGEMTGDGVSFVLTSSDESNYGQLDIAGGKEISFIAPEEGEEMAGIVFYQDRDAPDSNQCNSMTGTSAIELQGVAYFPSQCFTIGGNNDSSSSQESPCTRIIAKTIKLHGNPAMGNNCEGSAAADIGRVRVRLVL